MSQAKDALTPEKANQLAEVDAANSCPQREGAFLPISGASSQGYGTDSRAGALVAAVVLDAGQKSCAVLQSCGDVSQDVLRVAQFYEVSVDSVTLVSLSSLLKQAGGLVELQVP